MEQLTIKLLHERRNHNPRRKVDGFSGKMYPFFWSDEHKAYVYTTAIQDEADDLFNAQGRAMGSYFAPLITIKPAEAPKALSTALTEELLLRGLPLPDAAIAMDPELVGLAVLAGYEKGFKHAQEDAPKAIVPPAEVQTPAASPAPVAAIPSPAKPVAAKKPSPSVKAAPTPTA